MEIEDSALGRSDWDAAIGGAALQHGWAYGAVAARHGAVVRRVELRAGSSRGLAQIVCRSPGPFGVAYLPLGVRWIEGDPDQPMPWADLRRMMSRHRSHLLVVPSDGRPQRWAPRLSSAREMATLALDGADLRGGMRKKWRNRLAAAERGGIEVAAERVIPGWLIEAERRQQRRRRYANLTPGWIAAWQQVAPGQALTLRAGFGADPIAAMSFVLHGRGATYLLGWASPEGRDRNAHNLLMWQAMRRLRDAGIIRLDLGQIDRAGHPGLARFKLGTGARIETLAPLHAVLPAIGRAPRVGAPRPDGAGLSFGRAP